MRQKTGRMGGGDHRFLEITVYDTISYKGLSFCNWDCLVATIKKLTNYESISLPNIFYIAPGTVSETGSLLHHLK
jgi:hypothetical protein